MNQTDYRYNLEYRETVRARMLDLATRFLSARIGVIEVARELRSFVDIPEEEFRPYLDVFMGIDSETDALPIGDVRLRWSPDAFRREDLKIAVAERRWLEQAMSAAKSLVRLLDPKSSG
jgi:hypothetical protein